MDSPVALNENARAAAINRYTAGHPADISLLSYIHGYFELARAGKTADFDDLAKADGWETFIPKLFIDQAKLGGHFRGIPVNANNQNYIWISKSAFAKAGITNFPRTIDELFAALDALKKAGLVPLAHGGQPWQDDALFSAILAGKGGAELYQKVYKDLNEDAVRSPEFKAVAETYKKLHDYIDPASSGRSWNDTTALLINGKAGVQILGEWVRGEFTRAGLTYGKDYESHVGPGNYAIIGGDVFVAAPTTDPVLRKKQEVFARTILDKDVQIALANAKGSLPIRTDIDETKLDPAAREGLSYLRDGTHLLLHPQTINSSDITGPTIDAITRFWNTPSETTDEFVDEFASAISNK